MKRLPIVDQYHIQEKQSISKLSSVLSSEHFILRSEDGGDFGVDRIIELILNGTATNIRTHVQIKSTSKKCTNTNQITYSVPIPTLNYLLNTLNAIFLVYSTRNDTIYWEWAGIIESARRKNNSKENADTFNYKFTSILNCDSLKTITDQLTSDTALINSINLSGSSFQKLIINYHICEGSYRQLLVMYSEKKYEELIISIKGITDPTAEHYSLLSLCYYELQNYDCALNYITQAEKKSTNLVFAKIKASILCEKGLKEDNKLALNFAKNTLESVKEEHWCWEDYYNYANILNGLGEIDRAEINYLKSLTLEKNDAKVWKNLSDIYKQQGKHDEEVKCLEKSLSIDPNLLEGLVCLGISLGINYAKYDRAINLLETALNLQEQRLPNHIYFWIAEFNRRGEKFNEAIATITYALSLYPDDIYLTGLKVRTVVEAANFDDSYSSLAIAELENASILFPNDIKTKIKIIELRGSREPLENIIHLVEEIIEAHGDFLNAPVLLDEKLDDVLFILNNIQLLEDFRKVSNVCEPLFANFNTKISSAQTIELRMNFHFLRMCSSLEKNPHQEITTSFQRATEKLLSDTKWFANIILQGSSVSTHEEKTALVADLISILPRIMLSELSKQIGWCLQKFSIPVDIADDFLKSGVLDSWFDSCIEPILESGYEFFEWAIKK